MGRKLFLVSVVVCGGSFVNVSAQGYLTDTRTSNAMQMRDPARQASVDVDAAVVNPAGTAFLNDGLHVSASGFASFQSIDTKGIDGNVMSETKATQWLPAVQLVYKKDRWAVSASFANEGGRGRFKADKGSLYTNGVFENSLGESFTNLSDHMRETSIMLALLDVLSGNKLGFDYQPEDRLSLVTSNLETKEYNKTIRAGFTYKITDELSLHLGARANYVSVKGTTDLGLAVCRTSTGKYIGVKDYFSIDRDAIANGDFSDEIKEGLTDLSDALNELGLEMDALKSNSNYSVHGWGFAPVIGIDYKTGAFNFGAKYEFASHINLKNSSNTTFNVGNDFNIPALLSLGGSWQCNAKLMFALGGNVVFSENKFSLGSVDKSSASWDIAASATYDINNNFSISGGYTLGSYVWDQPEFLAIPAYGGGSDIIHKLSLGAAWNVQKNMQVNAGVTVGLPKNCEITTTSGTFTNTREFDYNTRLQLALGVNYSF